MEQGKSGTSLKSNPCEYRDYEYINGNYNQLHAQSQRAMIARERNVDISFLTVKKASCDLKLRNNMIRSDLRKINLAAVMRLCHFLGFIRLQKVAQKYKQFSCKTR